MKWDVKHDRAKKVIDHFLDNAGYWQELEDLVVGLTDEEKDLVHAEVDSMIASIRKRYKLQEHLPEQTDEAEKAVEEPKEESVKKPRARKLKTENTTVEKPVAKRTRTKKAEKEKAKDYGEND